MSQRAATRTREIVLLRRDVAPQNWHEPFSVLFHRAQSGEDGLSVSSENRVGGVWEHEWFVEDKDKSRIRHELTPPGWASFYKGEHGNAFLHVQNY